MRRFWNSFEVYVANIALMLLVIMLGIQVVARYILHIGLPWTEEMSRFSFIIFVYISASYAMLRGTHITVTMFMNLLPQRMQGALTLVGNVIQIIFFLTAAVAGLTLIQDMIAYPVYSSAMLLPLYYIYAVIPCAYFLMAVRLVQRMFTHYRVQ